MRDSLYKSTALSALAFASIVFFSLTQLAVAQTPPGSSSTTCAIQGFADQWLTGGTSEPVSPTVLAAASDEYASPNTKPSGNPIGMVQVWVVQTNSGQTAFYKNFQYMNVLHYYNNEPFAPAEVIDYKSAPLPYFGDKSDACAAAKAYQQSLAEQLHGSCNVIPISNCNCPAGPGLC